jgi:hypothetical protein
MKIGIVLHATSLKRLLGVFEVVNIEGRLSIDILPSLLSVAIELDIFEEKAELYQ